MSHLENIDKRKLVILAVLGISVLVTWRIYQRIVAGSDKELGRSPVSVAVEAASVRQGTVRDIGLFTGSLLPKSQFIVAPKVNGWLKKLLVNIGDTVKRDQVILYNARLQPIFSNYGKISRAAPVRRTRQGHDNPLFDHKQRHLTNFAVPPSAIL